jgi:tyrosinase
MHIPAQTTLPLRPLFVILALAPVVLLFGCENPTRPGESQALVEVQINDSPETGDDYVSPGTSTPARARITNDNQINSSVNVTFKNSNPTRGGQVRFGSGGTNVTTLTLPADGSWTSFTVTGASGQLSQRDKDAIIGVAEDRSDGIVLARKALEVTSSIPPVPSPGIAIEVSETATSIDDYLTWAPTKVNLSLVGASGSGTKQVQIQNMTPVANGRLVFAEEGNISPPQQTASQSSITVDLPVSGSPVTIYVAGDCQISPSPSATCSGMSVYDKDAVMEVVDAASGNVLGRKGTMVRIRKDANTLTSDERDRFLNALAALNNRNTFDNYQVYQDIHRLAVAEAHGNPSFLPWHRTYILRLERELQAIDPSVALPYWQFDEAAPDVFDRDFMGDHFSSSSSPIASGNPLSNWDIRRETVPSNTSIQTGITRAPSFAPTSAPSLRSESATLGLGANFSGFRSMEGDPHGSAHVDGGGSGWLSSLNTAVMDPIFFLLHSNVDRLWAKWQFMEIRYDPTQSASYEPQGTHPGSGRPRIGAYAEDEMWPWNGVTGTPRPQYAPGGEFPQTVGQVLAPPPNPTPADLVPYESAAGPNPDGLGFGYDDVPFKP